MTSREKSPEIVIFRIILIGRPPRVKSWDQKYFPFFIIRDTFDRCNSRAWTANHIAPLIELGYI